MNKRRVKKMKENNKKDIPYEFIEPERSFGNEKNF